MTIFRIESKQTNIDPHHHNNFVLVTASHWLCLLMMLGLLFTFQSASAQLKLYPVQRSNPTTPNTIKATSSARTKTVAPLTLPFWDDFSTTPVNDPTDTLANYPLRSLWEPSEGVWVNNGLGINPPSSNVASFDGLDSVGLPYSDQILLNGFRDKLTSLPIKITDVPVIERGSVFLSFFFQLQGHGEWPDSNDFLRLEFKDSTDTWIPIMTIRPKTYYNRNIFYDTIVSIQDRLHATGDTIFFHDDFQFRFQNYGRKSGPYDTWNIDYVLLNKGRTINSNSFPDRAIASTATSLLGDYYAVPVQHFFDTKPFENVQFDATNLKAQASNASYSAVITTRNYVGGIESTNSATVVALEGVGGGSGIMDPFEHLRVIVSQVPDGNDAALFNPAADSIHLKLKTTLITEDFEDPLLTQFLPLDFTINDTLSTSYIMDDYYAYDDGTAEYAAGTTNPGNILAYAFEQVSAAPDTLASFEAYFPDFGLGTNRLVNFYIYPDNNGKPDSSNPLLVARNRTVQRKGLNTFQLISIEPIKVPMRFYIGYESQNIQVGLDVSHDTSDKIFLFKNDSWHQNPDEIYGSLMIRPLFIEGVGGGPLVGLPDERPAITIYPNPSQGQFYVDGPADLVTVSTVTGQNISFEKELDGNRQKISLHHTSRGIYLLRFRQGDSIITRKLAVQ